MLENIGLWLSEYPEGAKLLREAQRLHPDDYWLCIRAAGTVSGVKDEEAIGFLRAARSIRPDDPTVRTVLGLALWRLGKAEDAEAEFRGATLLDPKFLNPRLNLADLLVNQGRDQEAVGALKAVLELAPGDFLIYCRLASILQRMNRLEEAASAARRACDNNPKDAFSRYIHGVILDQLGRFEEAEIEMHQAVLLDSKNHNYHLRLGTILEGLGKKELAAEQYRECLRLSPDDAESHCNLGLCLIAMSRYKDAVVELKRGHELGAKKPTWFYPTANWLANAEELAALGEKVPEMLRNVTNANAHQLLALARLCDTQELFFKADQLHQAAFAADPTLVRDRRYWRRYDAAASAARAGCGRSKDASTLDEPVKKNLRFRPANG